MTRVGEILCRSIMAVATITTVSGSAARAASEPQKKAILTTMAEAALATSYLVEKRTSDKILKGFWSATYSERTWKMRVEGWTKKKGKFHFTMSGYLWGKEKEDWLITYSGLGTGADEPIAVNGRANWEFDKKISDHSKMTFYHVAKFGKHSTWGWIVGSETVVGATLAATGAIATVAAATGGIGVLGAAGIAAAALIPGASAAITLSKQVGLIKESSEPVSAPALPEPPKPPSKGQKLTPSKDTNYIVISQRNNILAVGPGGHLFVYGAFKDGSGTGPIIAR